jgi:membrane fusion protein, multidrug efflux system
MKNILFPPGISTNTAIAGWVVVVFVLWMLTGLFTGTDAEKPTPQAPRKTAQTVALTAEDHVRLVTVTGRTEARNVADVAAQVAGVVESLTADRGDEVTAGQPLARIELATRAADLKGAEARAREAEIQYRASERLNREGFAATTKLAAEESSRASAQAALTGAKRDFSNTRVSSPLNGRIEERLVDEGDYVQVGTVLFRVIDPSDMRAVVYVSQGEQSLIESGQTAQVRLFDGRTLSARVIFIARQADAMTKTYRVDLQLDPTADSIPAGMTASAKIPTQPVKAHRVPHSALVLGDDGTLGVIYDAGGVAKFTAVAPLESTPEGLWLTGLPDSVNLVVVGQGALKDGDPIDVQPKAGS